MNLLSLFSFLAFPLCIFASSLSSRYAESLVHNFHEGKFVESLQLLDEWEILEPKKINRITGIKAAVYFSIGEHEKGKRLMEQFILGVALEELSEPRVNHPPQTSFLDLPKEVLDYWLK
jgi:hypothetical protein